MNVYSSDRLSESSSVQYMALHTGENPYEYSVPKDLPPDNHFSVGTDY